MQAIDTFENRVSSWCRTVRVFPGFQCLYHKQITITFLPRWNSVILNISWILDNTTISCIFAFWWFCWKWLAMYFVFSGLKANATQVLTHPVIQWFYWLIALLMVFSLLKKCTNIGKLMTWWAAYAMDINIILHTIFPVLVNFFKS